MDTIECYDMDANMVDYNEGMDLIGKLIAPIEQLQISKDSGHNIPTAASSKAEKRPWPTVCSVMVDMDAHSTLIRERHLGLLPSFAPDDAKQIRLWEIFPCSQNSIASTIVRRNLPWAGFYIWETHLYRITSTTRATVIQLVGPMIRSRSQRENAITHFSQCGRHSPWCLFTHKRVWFPEYDRVASPQIWYRYINFLDRRNATWRPPSDSSSIQSMVFITVPHAVKFHEANQRRLRATRDKIRSSRGHCCYCA